MEPLLFADDDSFWFETMRTLGASAWGGAEPGEVFTTAEQISAGDYDGWHDQWLATAVRVDAEARQALETGHRISARDGLLRANNYYRAAEFFLHENQEDPRINHAYKLARDCFHAAAPLFDPPIQIVEIPYEGTVLHGYFYPAAGSEADDGPRPTMVLHNGFDGTCEELHYSGAMAGQERGYHVLTFDGPGQPAARHLDGLVFRADWENVVGPVLDWLLQRPEVDASRIGLLGLSMGGLLAPRAAAFDDRIAACVAFDGVYDLGAAVISRMPGTREQAKAVLNADSAPEVDAIIQEMMAGAPSIRWAATHGQYVMGVHSPRAFFASYLDYTLADGVAERITCPTLVLDAEEDIFFGGQPEQLYDHLGGPRTLIRFTSAEGAGAHCQAGAQRLACGRIYDWLDEVLTNAS